MGYLDKAGLSRAFTKLKTLIDKKQDAMKTITIPSSSNTNKGKWIKFATIDLSSAGAWVACSGVLNFVRTEGASPQGSMDFEVRNGNTAGTVTTISFTWTSLANNTYASSVSAVKVSNGKYDIYYKPVYDYETCHVSLVNGYNTGYFTFNTGSYAASITAASTSGVNSYASSAGSVAWSNVSDKPSTYAPSSHNHNDIYYTETEMDSKLNSKLGAVSANGYYGMAKPDGTASDWIRTTSAGIIPYQSGGSSALGTSSWPFSNAYITTVHGSLDGNAKSATSATSATTATKLATARTIGAGTAVTSTAQSFNGESNITIPINSVKESYLDWGGKNIQGDISPVGMSLSSEHSANRLAFINGNALTMEYSSDGGSTWKDYGYSVADKSAFCTTAKDVPIGRTSGSYTTSSKTRITINAQPYVYTNPRKMLINVSSSGGMTVLIEYKTGASGAAWQTFGTYAVSGWSGWNDIPLVLGTLGGGSSQTSNIWHLRMTFSMTSVNSGAATTASVLGIRLFGVNNWGSASENNNKGVMSSTGHLYSYDINANATFPAQVTATAFNGNASSASRAAQLTTARTIKTNLGSTSSESFNGTANVTPGVTGTLGVANGGTGVATLTSGAALIGNGTGAVGTRSITNMTSASYINYNTNLMTTNTLAYWNGSYNANGASNLLYCNKGAFGTAATKGVDTSATSGSSNLITSGAMYTALSGKVPTSRTVNGKALSADITLSAGDVGAAASSHSHNYAGSSSAGGNANWANGATYANYSYNDKPITTAGNGAAYTASVSGLTLVVGASFVMVPHTVSTSTAPTLNVNSLGAKNIRMRISSSTSSTTTLPSASFLAASKPVRMVYDGTYWIIDDMVRPDVNNTYGTLISRGTAAPTSGTAGYIYIQTI